MIFPILSSNDLEHACVIRINSVRYMRSCTVAFIWFWSRCARLPPFGKTDGELPLLQASLRQVESSESCGSLELVEPWNIATATRLCLLQLVRCWPTESVLLVMVIWPSDNGMSWSTWSHELIDYIIAVLLQA